MFNRYSSDVKIENLRTKVLELKEVEEQVALLKGMNDWEFTRVVSFPESTQQFKSLFQIIAKDESLIERYSGAMEGFVRFSEGCYAGGFLKAATPQPPQGTKRYAGGPVWGDSLARETSALTTQAKL